MLLLADFLLIDKIKSTKKNIKNIILANNIEHGAEHYLPKTQIKPALITGKMERLIMPRALKSQEVQINNR